MRNPPSRRAGGTVGWALALVGGWALAWTSSTIIAAAPALPVAQATAAAESNAPQDPARALVDDGWQEMRFANWPKARDLLEQARKECANRADQAEAMFALGTLWQIRQPDGDAEKARQLYEQIVRDYADTPSAPWAHLALARLADMPEYEKQRNVALARQLYQEILNAYPDHAAADEAALRLAVTYLEKIGDTKTEDIGEGMLLGRLAERPANFLAAAMHICLGDLYERRGEYRKAIDRWLAADQLGIPGLADRATFYYRVGRIAETRLKDYLLAAKWYDRLVTEIRIDNKYYVSKLAVDRCLKLAGRPPKYETAPGVPTAKEGRP
jgi:tetratricopeptide (TPR) repeat protein